MIFPFPDYEKSLHSLQKPMLARLVRYWIPGLVAGDWWDYSKEWKYHYYQLAHYGLLGFHLIKQRSPDFPDLEHYYLGIKQGLPDTGLPEWWGTPEIHQSHKLFAETWSEIPSKNNYNIVIHPEVDLDERLRRLQPIIREFHDKKKKPRV